MTKLVIPAQYAHLIAGFQSTEETRYYLDGFFVQPHPEKGVILVATDGHRMGIMHAESGIVELGGMDGDIWRLSKSTLKTCADKHFDGMTRWLVIGGVAKNWVATVVFSETAEEAEAVAENDLENHMMLNAGPAKLVDGTYPDWRRVIPSTDKFKPVAGASFNANILTPFAKVAGTDSDGQKNMHYSLCLHTTGDSRSPMVVLTAREDFVGVLMPILSDRASYGKLPNWLEAKSKAKPAQAAE
jgi:DNA polymerase-3 subunit beta